MESNSSFYLEEGVFLTNWHPMHAGMTTCVVDSNYFILISPLLPKKRRLDSTTTTIAINTNESIPGLF